MTTDGFRPDSARNPSGMAPDSGLNTASKDSQQSPASARERALRPDTRNTEAKIRLREIHHLDALAVAVVAIRPEWAPDLVRAVLARTPASPRDLTRHALECALDPDVRHPARIENLDRRAYEPTPLPPSLDEWRNADRCDEHGAVRTACALCRRGIGPTDEEPA